MSKTIQTPTDVVRCEWSGNRANAWDTNGVKRTSEITVGARQKAADGGYMIGRFQIKNGKMTLKKYYHVGVAVDTPNGLMVPKIRNANTKKILSISKELKELSELCRNLKIDKKELFGGAMTITSLGGIGGSFFTPIINYPEVAILGIGKSQKKQILMNGKFQTRTMLPISLSYDHRIIDGAEAARFNNDLKDNLGRNFAYKLAI